ncbi:hypothetical protein QE152_g3724 [Popillia japonica]|uniref:Uncharacterized protein n=1 Tax=Popillia japonica TaxID=7064 RepID=A0AAW1MZX1_POPJA
MKSRSCRLSKHELRIRHRKTAPDLHKATRYANVRDLWLFLFDSRNYYMDCIRMDENYANVRDLWLFLFDSRNYYMDCIRMDENHILCPKEEEEGFFRNESIQKVELAEEEEGFFRNESIQKVELART